MAVVAAIAAGGDMTRTPRSSPWRRGWTGEDRAILNSPISHGWDSLVQSDHLFHCVVFAIALDFNTSHLSGADALASS